MFQPKMNMKIEFSQTCNSATFKKWLSPKILVRADRFLLDFNRTVFSWFPVYYGKPALETVGPFQRRKNYCVTSHGRLTSVVNAKNLMGAFLGIGLHFTWGAKEKIFVYCGRYSLTRMSKLKYSSISFSKPATSKRTWRLLFKANVFHDLHFIKNLSTDNSFQSSYIEPQYDHRGIP